MTWIYDINGGFDCYDFTAIAKLSSKLSVIAIMSKATINLSEAAAAAASSSSPPLPPPPPPSFF